MAIFRPADRLGAFEIVDLLSANHRYECYRARSSGRSYALKIPSPDNPFRGSVEADIRRQANFLNPDRCPVDRISHYLDVLPVGDTVAILMEHVDGEPLTRRIGDASWDMNGRVELLRRLGATLDALHALDIAHRDVSDGNVLVVGSGMPVLIDFELSARIPLVDDEQISLTSGNRLYKSPEQWTGDPQTGAVDVFSFALLSSYILGRRLPSIDSKDVIGTYLPSEGRVPSRLIGQLRAALSRDAARRPATCLELFAE